MENPPNYFNLDQTGGRDGSISSKITLQKELQKQFKKVKYVQRVFHNATKERYITGNMD